MSLKKIGLLLVGWDNMVIFKNHINPKIIAPVPKKYEKAIITFLVTIKLESRDNRFSKNAFF